MAAMTPIVVDCPYCGRPIECTANLEPGDLVTQDTVTVNLVVDYDHTCPKRPAFTVTTKRGTLNRCHVCGEYVDAGNRCDDCASERRSPKPNPERAKTEPDAGAMMPTAPTPASHH
jgi:hypothetical protein